MIDVAVFLEKLAISIISKLMLTLFRANTANGVLRQISETREAVPVAKSLLYFTPALNTSDHSHKRKQHMGSVDVYKDSFQLYVLETTTETKCHHWAEGKHECTKSECKVGYE